MRYELAADRDRTILNFTHCGLSVANAEGFVPGTHAYLDRLGAYLEQSRDPAHSQLATCNPQLVTNTRTAEAARSFPDRRDTRLQIRLPRIFLRQPSASTKAKTE